jgi:hypothetical protein
MQLARWLGYTVREVLRKDGIVHNPWVQAHAALFALLLAAFPYYLSAGAQPDFSHGLEAIS